MNPARGLLVVAALVAALGLTLVGAPGQAARVGGANDRFGTYSDLDYGTAFPQGYYGQITWSKALSIKAKRTYKDVARVYGPIAGAQSAARELCGAFATPMGQNQCAFYLFNNWQFWDQTINQIGEIYGKCIALRWYASPVYDQGRHVSAVGCFTAGGGGGGGGAWKETSRSEIVEPVEPTVAYDGYGIDDDDGAGRGGGATW